MMPAAREPVAGGGVSGTAEALVRAALTRIERDNPRLGALTEVFTSRALDEAHALDGAAADGPAPSAVAGQPLAVKDLIDTTPGVCRAGLEALRDYRPEHDAEVVARLRRAGAVVVGVSATDRAGFGVRTPEVRHPDIPGLSVGGSSGGSAVAVRAGFAAAALGTDTGGSVRIPAACCGVAGFKPSFGRLPMAGVRPLAPSLDHVGMLAPRVRDLAAWQPLLDPSPGGTAPAPYRGAVRVGVDRSYFADADPGVRAAVEQALRAAADSGMEVRDVRLPHPDSVAPVHSVIFSREAAACYRETFDGRAEELPATIRQVLAWGAEIPAEEYERQCRARDALRARVDAALADVDVLMLPTLPVAPPARDAARITLAGREHPFTAALLRYTMLFNHTGHPVLALPYGRLAGGLPASLQLVGSRDRDDALISLGLRLEERLASGERTPQQEGS